jgi:hypothetical protein
VRYDELGIGRVERQRAGDEDLSRDLAGLPQDVLDARPVHREKQGIRLNGGLARRSGPRPRTGAARDLLELVVVPGVAEDDVVSRPGEDRPELAAHRAGAEDADSHGRNRVLIARRSSIAR